MPAYDNYKNYTKYKKCCRPFGTQGPQGIAGALPRPSALDASCTFICEASGATFLDINKLKASQLYVVVWDTTSNSYKYLVS